MKTNSEILINPSIPAQRCIIWLHGLGADGNDFAPLVPELNLADTRFIFPNAPFQPVTINQGYVMRAWYDIYTMKIDQKIDHEGIDKSVKLIEALIAKEKHAGIPSDKIILAGFSQGAVIALITALRCSERLGGVLALSGYLPFAETLLANSPHHFPIFLAHGTEDTVVPYSLGIASYTILKKHGFPVEWHTYLMGHSVCNEEIKDIAAWLA